MDVSKAVLKWKVTVIRAYLKKGEPSNKQSNLLHLEKQEKGQKLKQKLLERKNHKNKRKNK